MRGRSLLLGRSIAQPALPELFRAFTFWFVSAAVGVVDNLGRPVRKYEERMVSAEEIEPSTYWLESVALPIELRVEIATRFIHQDTNQNEFAVIGLRNANTLCCSSR
jgi:hypothetical protein